MCSGGMKKKKRVMHWLSLSHLKKVNKNNEFSLKIQIAVEPHNNSARLNGCEVTLC